MRTVLVVIIVSGSVFACDKGEQPAEGEAVVEQPEEAVVAPVERPDLPVFVRIEPGVFSMGSPLSEPSHGEDEQVHTVTITRAYYLQAHEVTQDEWLETMGNSPSHFSSCGGECPVESVSWFDAAAFANSRSAAEGLQECYDLTGCVNESGEDLRCNNVSFVGLDCSGYRLPTEAEWEYAARAGSSGPQYAELDTIAWYEFGSGNRPHRVGEREANDWGFYDMLGNVQEWTGDWYAPYGEGAQTDPQGADNAVRRSVRGGSYRTSGRNTRAAHRNHLEPGIRGRRGANGLRLARTVQ